MTSGRDEQFNDFVVARRGGLLRTATLLTAGDTHLAEDLVQTALTKLYLAWPSYQRADSPDGYLRRILVNALTDERRRSWWRKESPTAEPPDRSQPEAQGGDIGHALRAALRELPPRMRAAVVFRYIYDLGVAQTADALGCSEGTVKSQTARALDKLRTVLDTEPPHRNTRLLRQEVSS